MPRKAQLPQINPKLLQENSNAKDLIQLDLDNNVIVYNDQFKKALTMSKDVSQRAKKLLQVDVKDMSEDDMSNLRKDFKPVIDYQKKFDSFEKEMKRSLKSRDQMMVDTYHKILSDNGFDEIPELTKKYRAYDREFKANRANMRWEEIHERFNASMDTYPEFQKYAPDTLGSFNYYRLHHPDLISEAKTKPVTKATIAEFNQDLYQYHQDMERLLSSTLTPAYYPRLIEQYADDPSTTNMINLIDRTLQQQIKDNQAKLLQQVAPEITKLLGTLWYQNDKLNQLFANAKAPEFDTDKFNLEKLQLMKQEADAISATLDPNQFISNNQINTDKIELTLKPLLSQAAKRVYGSLTQLKTPQKPQEAQPKENVAQANPEHPQAKTPQVQPEPYAWLIDYLQANKMQNIHDNDKLKVDVLNDLFQNVTAKDSIWRHNVHSYHEIIELVKYIANM